MRQSFFGKFSSRVFKGKFKLQNFPPTWRCTLYNRRKNVKTVLRYLQQLPLLTDFKLLLIVNFWNQNFHFFQFYHFLRTCCYSLHPHECIHQVPIQFNFVDFQFIAIFSRFLRPFIDSTLLFTVLRQHSHPIYLHLIQLVRKQITLCVKSKAHLLFKKSIHKNVK